LEVRDVALVAKSEVLVALPTEGEGRFWMRESTLLRSPNS
jgi:hypothetical protein